MFDVGQAPFLNRPLTDVLFDDGAFVANASTGTEDPQRRGRDGVEHSKRPAIIVSGLQALRDPVGTRCVFAD